jgi:hypothetical protein
MAAQDPLGQGSSPSASTRGPGQTSNIRKLCEIQVLFWRLYITVSNTTPRFMTKSRSTLYLFTHTW